MDVPVPTTSYDTHRVADHMSKLAFLFPLGLDGKSTRTRNFEDVDFDSITEVLRTLDLRSWSTIPRTYAVLRMINRIDDIDAFTTLKLSDLSIPYSNDNLPQSLSLSTKAKFIQEQALVLTKDLQFERIADLGRGGGCTHVEKVWSNVGQKYYAVKYIRRAQYFQNDRKALKDFESELQNAKKVAHHHVVKIVGSFTELRSVGIIMGTIGEQNLAQLLRGVVTSDTRSLLRTYFGCLASGLFAIHQADIKHKDIKPENVIIRKSVVYLTDFGLALDFSTTPENRSTTIGKPSVKHTPLYSAPEWWDYSRRDRRSDIWSLGAVYLEIATVLYEETIPKLFDFLGRHGSQNVLSYSRNMPGVREWIEILRSKHGHEKDTAAVDLILATMKERIEERPTSYELWNLVERFSPPDVSFACRACFESFNPSEKEREELDLQHPITPETSSTLSASSRSTDVTEPSTTIETLASPSSSLLAQKQSLSVWDQHAENEKLFGIKTDPDENIFTTKIDANWVKERLAETHREARDFESVVTGSRSLNPISGDKTDVGNHPMEAVVHAEASMPEASASDPSKSTAEVHAKRDISQSFKAFAARERERVTQTRIARGRADKELKLNDLKKFADSFKLQTRIPSDLIPIIAKDPTKQKEIQQKSLRNAEDAKVIVMKDFKIPPENVWRITKEQNEQQSTSTAIRDQTYSNGNQTETITTNSIPEETMLTRLMAMVESTKHLAIPAENGAGGQSIRQGQWTIREDAQLIRAVHFSKPRNWQWISAVVGTRSQGQCKKGWKKVEVLFGDAEGTRKLIHVLEGSRSLDL